MYTSNIGDQFSGPSDDYRRLFDDNELAIIELRERQQERDHRNEEAAAEVAMSMFNTEQFNARTRWVRDALSAAGLRQTALKHDCRLLNLRPGKNLASPSANSSSAEGPFEPPPLGPENEKHGPCQICGHEIISLALTTCGHKFCYECLAATFSDPSRKHQICVVCQRTMLFIRF